MKWSTESRVIPFIKTTCPTSSLPLLVAYGRGALWSFADSPGFFCVVLSLILFLSVALFSFFHGTAENFRGDLRGIWSYPDFSLTLCVEVWLTSSFVCFFPGTFPSPANSCLQGAHALCRAWWLRLEDELLCRPLFDRWSQLRLYTC